MWIDAGKLRTQDLSLAADLRGRGVKTLLVGQNLPENAADLVFNVPAMPPGWQFLVDTMPTQVASEPFNVTFANAAEDTKAFATAAGYTVEYNATVNPALVSSFRWRAFYSGNNFNSAQSSACGDENITLTASQK